MVSFRRAVELGAQAIETDLQLTRDGRLVILHDRTLRRTTGVRGRVACFPLERLRELDAGSWFPRGRPRRARSRPPFAGERIPVIEEVLDFARETGIELYLEMKTGRGAGAEPAIVKAIRAAGAFQRVRVICFDAQLLLRVREMEPAIRVGLLFSRRLRHPVRRALAAGADALLPQARRASQKLIAEARGAGLKVIVWTVNDPKTMQVLIERGADGIMTDFPDRLAGILRNQPRFLAGAIR